MIPDKFGGHSVRATVFEFALIVLGVLVALAVDEWQEERKDAQFLTGQLESIVSEIDANLFTIQRIRTGAIPSKMNALEQVIGTLENPDPRIGDLDALLSELAYASRDTEPWFTRDRFDALRSSGNFRIIGNRELEDDVSDVYNGVDVLLAQAERLNAGFPALVHQLLPARYQASLNPLRTYTREGVGAPAIEDPETPAEITREILAHREEILRLARAESALVTAKWYALTRIDADFRALRKELLAHPALEDSKFNE